MSKKKELRKRKMMAGFISKPLICKIEISEHGRKVMEYKGDMKNGFKRFKGMCEDVFQIVDKEEDTNESTNK